MRHSTLFKGVAVFCILAIFLMGISLKTPTRVPRSAVWEAYRRTCRVDEGKFTVNNGTALNETVICRFECPESPPNLLGRIPVNLELPSFEQLGQIFFNLLPGGRYHPQDCNSRHKVAIIVPYRNREEHLRVLLHNLHPILMRQQLDYGIYVVEQVKGITYNKARLMNIGFKEALKQYDYQCFIFHDVDLIPEDDRNLYHCPPKYEPRHMSVAINKYRYKLFYESLVGGVLALSKEQMIKVNGFSNEYWGWGGEDDDMYYRIKHGGFNITRYSDKIARYKMLKHPKSVRSPTAYQTLNNSVDRLEWDGLSNLKYELLDLRIGKLFTRLLVNITLLT